MKTAYYEKYGPPSVYKVKEVEKPTPNDNEMLIKIKASSVSSGDVMLRSFDIPTFYKIPMMFYQGFTKPKRKTLGSELSGIIEEIGANVKEFKKGDKVFGGTDTSMGTNTEYKIMSLEEGLVNMPKNMSFEEGAVMAFGGCTALYFLRKAGIKKGQKVLVYGASGAVGSAAVQLAKYFGAEVTAVTSKQNQKLMKQIGADKTIDYKTNDLKNGYGKFDIVYEVVGKSKFPENIQLLNKNGIFILNSVFDWKWYVSAVKNMMLGKKIVMGVAMGYKTKDLEFLKKLYEENRFKPVIDKTFKLADISKAHEYVDKGHKKGNVVIVN